MIAAVAEWGVMEWLGIITLALALLSLFGGAAWWMSAMWSKLCTVELKVDAQALEKAKDDEVVWKHINGHTDQLKVHDREILLLQSRRTAH